MADSKEERLRLIWEKAIDTQMHFNEMSVRSRQLGLSFVVGALALATALLSQEAARVTIPLVGASVHVGGLVLWMSAVGLVAVRQLDLEVYHKMLRGAVKFNERLESKMISEGVLPIDEGLTQTVSRYSRFKDGDKKAPKEPALERVNTFYAIGIAVILIVGAIALVATFRTAASDGRVQDSQCKVESLELKLSK